LFPDVLLTNEIKGIMPPFEFKPFYYSSRFKNILAASEEDFTVELNDYSEEQLYIYGCVAILGSYYKYAFPMGSPTLVDIPNKKLNIIKTYRLTMNGDLMEFIPTDKAVQVSFEDYLELLDNFDNIELWKQKFPPDSWIMRGIGITNLMDVTVDQSLASITSNLLNKSAGSMDKIHEGLRNLFGIRELRIGFLTYENNSFFSHQIAGMENMILGGKEKLDSKDALCSYSFDMLINQKQALIVSDVERFDERSKSLISKTLRAQPIKSYIIAPIRNNDDFLGFLELASPRKYDLNGASLQKLDAVMPILSMAIARFKREDQNRREAIIQQECTTIHPSVKWRFEEEADKFMQRQMRNEQPVFSDIVFKNVYPLYGQLDIKGSSEKRNKAVKADLTKQLTEVSKVLAVASEHTKMVIYEQLSFRVESYRKDLKSELLSGSEHRIINFLETEIHPVFLDLSKQSVELKKSTEAYLELLHQDMHSVYEQRKKYDHSVNIINQTLASFLDEKQVEAQQMFPHYFERYKTDGVEYNIYVGQSISKNMEFTSIYLQNLQLWQLLVTCEMEKKFAEVKDALDTDIEIASLILVYNTPLAVHFRMDEKRFDVEGAYNARYEIVKKRIDKAHVKNTSERITSPGKIAIIYSSEQDAITYGRYLSFLESKGYLKKGSRETLEVENLQGISGLKALRIAIDYDKGAVAPASFNVNEILEGLQNN
ncbi:MAG: GAF domain-containing protein, partial [Cyclobacteriaceae bacterium]